MKCQAECFVSVQSFHLSVSVPSVSEAAEPVSIQRTATACAEHAVQDRLFHTWLFFYWVFNSLTNRDTMHLLPLQGLLTGLLSAVL